jgi:hypothetical protein
VSTRSEIRDVLRRAKQGFDDRRLRRLASGEAPRGVPSAIVFGNCQAAPLAKILSMRSSFAHEFEIIRVPPVHEITRAQAEMLRQAIPKLSLYITQEIRDGYRSLPVGTNELTALLPATATVVRFPVLYHQGLFPYQVYVRTSGSLSEQAPITSYTDLRYLAFAGRGYSSDQAEVALLGEHADPASLRLVHETSVSDLRSREEHLDVSVSGLIAETASITPSFHTVNHPSNHVLEGVGDQVLTLLGFDSSAERRSNTREFLGQVLTPIETPVQQALSLGAPVRPDWLINGKRYRLAEIMKTHLAWLQANPLILDAGLRQHQDKLAALNLI